VHGLERIGAQVVLGFIETLVAALRWDRALATCSGSEVVLRPGVESGGVLSAGAAMAKAWI
jgi:hypothetical protein